MVVPSWPDLQLFSLSAIPDAFGLLHSNTALPKQPWAPQFSFLLLDDEQEIRQKLDRKQVVRSPLRFGSGGVVAPLQSKCIQMSPCACRVVWSVRFDPFFDPSAAKCRHVQTPATFAHAQNAQVRMRI